MSRSGGPVRTVVARLVGSGRGVAGVPAFEAGPLIQLGRAARGDAEVGDLVSITLRGRGARVSAVHGRARSVPAALAALLAHEGVIRPFPHAALRESEQLDEGAPLGDRGRRDLRDQRVITIDPAGARDHDDAIAVAPEGPDATRLWVHIADVSRFVAPGGPLDRVAARRGNSLYLPGMVVPMLPQRLSSDLCSLRPEADRATLTVELVIGPDGRPREERFYRALIRSRRRIGYPEVDDFLAGGSMGDEALERDIARAAGLAAVLRERRLERGALEVQGGEPTIGLAGDRVASIEIEGQTPAHSLVEECMIAANEAVARFLIARRVRTIFRHHEDPAETRIRLLYEQLEALDVATTPLADGPLAPVQRRAAAGAAAEAVRRHLAAGRAGGDALWGLVLRSLKQAHYTPENATHSGLASAAYLHFTSPIRRYPDLLVHRGLVDALGLGGPSPGMSELAQAAEHCSGTEREAAALERRADDLCAAYWLQDRLREGDPDRPFDGAISGVIESGVFVTFAGVCTGFLPARNLEDDHYRPDPLGVMLVGDRSGRRLRMGDAVAVRVDEIEALRGRITLSPAEAPRPRPRAGGRQGARPAGAGWAGARGRRGRR